MIGIYSRVSTLAQAEEGYSLETQEKLCMDRAVKMGYSTSQINVYREGGRSGEDIDRPEMNKLREDTATGKIHKVIITDPDRLTRDLTDKLIVCKEWDRQNVEIIFIDTEYQNTPEGQMFFNMRSVFAQYELAQIRKRTTRGRLRAVEKDKKVMPMRVAPYGYDYKDGQLTVNEKEAKFVRKIYGWYLSGHTLREIGTLLFEEGAVPKRKESKNFGASSISRILTSEIYIGQYIYNKRQGKKVWGEKTASGKAKMTRTVRDENDWIRVEVPSIVDKITYDSAQKQREKNTKKRGNVKFEYLFKGMIRCKCCNRTWECTTYSGREDKKTGERKKYGVYRCPNLNPKRYGDGVSKCPSISIRVDEIEDYILTLIQDTLTDHTAFEKAIKEQMESFDETLDSKIEDFKKQLFKKQNERDRIKQMFIKNVITEDEMIKDMKAINNELTSINEKMESILSKRDFQNSQRLSQDTIDAVIENVHKLFEKDGLTFLEKRQLIELIIDEIEIDATNEKVEISIKGPLDDIVSCSERQEI
ncbi:recombinase family protein [Fictibacillus sp. KU28468]|uniref:recombinase family protein n=1 Tax=Fictibacillus sp. KU28468 TaxID=2991053 RepID=UPI00223CAC99|nr:recombinase family protein [Fictibacillus sp. KU28468]UZJ80566.1 recombinase family protein [Fictibacillus sp. KU28468]